MASIPEGDIPGFRQTEPNLMAVASQASGGANAVVGWFGPYGYPIRVRNIWYTPTQASVSASQTATYRRLSLYNGGPTGTVTATGSRIASLNISATNASLSPLAFAVVDATGTTQTVASGNIMYFSQETVGGTDANGTVLQGGYTSLSYEIV